MTWSDKARTPRTAQIAQPPTNGFLALAVERFPVRQTLRSYFEARLDRRSGSACRAPNGVAALPACQHTCPRDRCSDPVLHPACLDPGPPLRFEQSDVAEAAVVEPDGLDPD